MKRVLKSSGVVLAVIVVGSVAAWWWFLVPALSDPPELPGTLSAHSVQHDGVSRSWRAYVPSSLAESLRIVLVLHGSNSDGDEMLRWSSHGFSRMAEQSGFIAVYPDGYQRYWNDCRRNAGYPANREGIDDVGFLQALVSQIESEHGGGEATVYVVGVSNGGHMAYRLGYEAPQFVRGIAAIVANVPVSTNLACDQAGVPVATLILNGTEDPINPYEGGLVTVFSDTTRGRVMSARGSADYWARLAGYEEPGHTTEWPDRDPTDGTQVVATSWAATGEVPVTLISVRGGGHALPHPSSRWPRVLGRTSREFDTAEVVWQFFDRIESPPGPVGSHRR